MILIFERRTIITLIKLPYGDKTLKVHIPEKRLESILVSRVNEYHPNYTEDELIQNALEHPVESPLLRDLAKNKKSVVIVSSDHTRPVPSHITLPLLLEEIRNGNPRVNITILVATGMHRKTTESELQAKYGDRIVKREKIVIHDSKDSASMIRIGTLPSGGALVLNRLAMEADLLVAEGFIEPHFFAGFSGGCKSILPGIASYETVLANHCSEFIASPYARTGILKKNPLQLDMLYAGEKAKLAFILNVVINTNKKIIHAVAGHREKAHLKGCDFVSNLASVQGQPADIVITANGGYPMDQNIYQTVKGMTAAEATCKPGGVIIAVSECRDGHGGESFYKTFASTPSVQTIMNKLLSNSRDQTIPDSWEIQILARILLKHKVILVSDATRTMIESMGIYWAPDVGTAIHMTDMLLGRDNGNISVIPDGVSVIVSS